MQTTFARTTLHAIPRLFVGSIVGLATTTVVLWSTHGSLLDAASHNGPWFLGLVAAGLLAGAGIELAVYRRSPHLSTHLWGPALVATVGLLGTVLGGVMVNGAIAEVTEPDILARLASQGSMVALGTAANGLKSAGLLALYGLARRVSAEAWQRRDALVAEGDTPWLPALGIALVGGTVVWGAQLALGLGSVGVLLAVVAGVALCASAGRQAFSEPLGTLACGATVAAVTALAAGDWVMGRMSALESVASAESGDRLSVVTEGLAQVDLALWAVPSWVVVAAVAAVVANRGRLTRPSVVDLGVLAAMGLMLAVLTLGAGDQLGQASQAIWEGARAVAS